jgi:hypothetical protein
MVTPPLKLDLVCVTTMAKEYPRTRYKRRIGIENRRYKENTEPQFNPGNFLGSRGSFLREHEYSNRRIL